MDTYVIIQGQGKFENFWILINYKYNINKLYMYECAIA